ncbi:MAG: response regulator [Candidatus Aenigmarchaeota archaeon]|nr:response regulator [Candidatus Aenigmarchaeota archaeon]
MNRRRILIADDESGIRRMYEIALMGVPNLDIDVAGDGQELVDNVEKYPDYNLIITDYLMPRLNGVDAIRKIRELGYKGSVILISSNDFSGDHIKEIEELGVEVVKKPVPATYIRFQVTNYLENSQ